MVDYCSKFLIVKKADSLAADDLVKVAKIVFIEFGLPKKHFKCMHELSHQIHPDSIAGKGT